MPLRDQRQTRPLAVGDGGQAVAQCCAVLDRAEVAAVSGGEAVAELVDGPQIDARGVEREAVPVIDARVLTEAVQEDDGGTRLGGGPVPVVGAALWVIDERHAMTAARAAADRKTLDRLRFYV